MLRQLGPCAPCTAAPASAPLARPRPQTSRWPACGSRLQGERAGWQQGRQAQRRWAAGRTEGALASARARRTPTPAAPPRSPSLHRPHRPRTRGAPALGVQDHHLFIVALSHAVALGHAGAGRVGAGPAGGAGRAAGMQSVVKMGVSKSGCSRAGSSSGEKQRSGQPWQLLAKKASRAAAHLERERLAASAARVPSDSSTSSMSPARSSAGGGGTKDGKCTVSFKGRARQHGKPLSPGRHGSGGALHSAGGSTAAVPCWAAPSAPT